MNRRQRRGVSLATLLATLAGVSLILMTLVLGAGASAGTTIGSSSATMTTGGNTTTVITANLTAADSGKLFGFDVTVHFNPLVATASVNPGLDLGAGWSNQAVIPTPVDNSTGIVHFVATRVTACPNICPLFTIHWHGEAAGTFNITFSEAVNFPSLGDENAVAISWEPAVPSGVVTVNAPPTSVTPATNTPVTPATNTPVTPATNTPVTPATNTPVTPGTATNTPVTPSTNTPTTPSTNTPTGTLTPQPTASGSNTPVPTSTPVTTTPTSTPIPGGPRTYKLYLPEVADDGIPGSGQLVRALSEGVVGRVLGPLLGN